MDRQIVRERGGSLWKLCICFPLTAAMMCFTLKHNLKSLNRKFPVKAIKTKKVRGKTSSLFAAPILFQIQIQMWKSEIYSAANGKNTAYCMFNLSIIYLCEYRRISKYNVSNFNLKLIWNKGNERPEKSWNAQKHNWLERLFPASTAPRLI